MDADTLTDDLHAGRVRRKVFPAHELAPLLPAEPAAEENVADDHRAYAGGRVGTRPLVAVCFRAADGREVSFAYSHLYCVDAPCPNAGFVAEFTRHRVSVTGRNLARLARLVAEHRAREVAACDPAHALLVPDGEPVVTGLAVEEKRSND